MAGNDISSLIQDIYDRYKENQKDKKPEEQMYMSEEEFKANLKSMVNKSDIEDKFMLYNEIYLHITEDALEIDTTGNITISPKVIVNAEKEVIRRLEEHKNVENSKIGIEEAVAGKIIFDMTKEEYNNLSHEEKKELFSEATEWIFGSKEKAQKEYEEIARSQTTTDRDIVEDAQKKLQNGLTLSVDDLKNIYGTEVKETGTVNTQRNILDRTSLIQQLAESNEFGAFYVKKKDSDSYELNVPMINIIANEFRDDNERTDEEILDFITKVCEIHEISDNQKVYLERIIRNRKKFSTLVNGLTALARENNIGKDYLMGFGIDQDNLDLYYASVDDAYKAFSKALLQDFYDTNKMDNSMEPILEYATQVEYMNIRLRQEYTHEGLKRPDARTEIKDNNIAINPMRNGVNIDLKTFYTQKSKPEMDEILNGYIAVNDMIDFKSIKANKQNGEERITGDNAKTDVESVVDTELEADFESSLASISDMEPDMFAGMFESMAEEIVFEEPTFETEKVVQEDETHEVAGDDRTAQGEKETQILEEVGTEELTEKEVKGIQVENIAIDEEPTNTMNNENLPKKITWGDKVRASVDAFGKNVKKAFGSFISAITGKGGENNSAANNSTSSTSSSAGQNKHVQEVKNFVPTVELNLKQAQQATKAAEESKKNNDARGTDEPIQDDSEIGE